MTNHIEVAGVVVCDQMGRHLLVQENQANAYGLWNLPAGHVDEGETPAQAALREADEETGFTMELISQKPVFQHQDAKQGYTFYAFSARVTGGKISIPNDIMDVQWLEMDKIIDLYNKGKLRAEWIYVAIKEAEKNENSGD